MPQSADDIAKYGDRTAANAANAKFQAASDLFASQNSKGQATPDQKAAYASAQAEFGGMPLASGTNNPGDAGLTEAQAATRNQATPDNRGLGNFTGTTDPNGTGVALDNNGQAQTNNGQPVGPGDTGSIAMPTGAAANTVFDPISGKQVSPEEAAFNATSASGKTAPQDSSEASGTVKDEIAKATPPQPDATTTPAVDSFFQNSPNVVSSAQQIQDFLSPQATQDQLDTEVSQINTDNTTLGGLNTKLMNIENVMSGTETDIRNEIQASGGMATNSQVMALSAARNKVLLQQAKTIQQQIATQKSIVANDTSLYTKDKALADKQYTERSSALKLAEANQKNIDTAQKSGAALLLKTMGPAGVYAALSSDPQAVSNFEQSIGWQPGDLAAAATSNQSGTVTTYETDPKTGVVNKVTTKNGVQTSTVEQKPKAPAKGHGQLTPAQQKKQKYTNDINSTDMGLSKNAGQDGYVSPEVYKGARAAWIKEGNDVTVFNSKFSKYANPADLQDYR